MQTHASPTLRLWRTLHDEWPKTSKRRPHRQRQAVGGKGRRRRRKRSTRKGWESKRVSLLVGKLENGSAAMGAPWDNIRARSGSVLRLFFSNTTDAGRCHPWFATVSTISSSGFGRFVHSCISSSMRDKIFLAAKALQCKFLWTLGWIGWTLLNHLVHGLTCKTWPTVLVTVKPCLAIVPLLD